LDPWRREIIVKVVSLEKKGPLNRCPRIPAVKEEIAGTGTSSY
jgi:hypothetical protein